MRQGGESGDDFSIGDIMGNSGARGDHRLSPHSNVVGDPRLASDHDMMAGRTAACDAHLGHDDIVFADLHVVRDLDEVIHFRPSPDNRSAEGGTVNRDVRSQLDIIFDDHRPDLGDLMMAALMLEKAEAVAADHRPRMDDDPVADHHAFSNRHVRIQ